MYLNFFNQIQIQQHTYNINSLILKMEINASMTKQSDKVVHVFTLDGSLWFLPAVVCVQTVQYGLVQEPGTVALHTIHQHVG